MPIKYVESDVLFSLVSHICHFNNIVSVIYSQGQSVTPSPRQNINYDLFFRIQKLIKIITFSR